MYNDGKLLENGPKVAVFLSFGGHVEKKTTHGQWARAGPMSTCPWMIGGSWRGVTSISDSRFRGFHGHGQSWSDHMGRWSPVKPQHAIQGTQQSRPAPISHLPTYVPYSSCWAYSQQACEGTHVGSSLSCDLDPFSQRLISHS